jgi:glycosyltransferase involved in cell wall biosynthesis
LNILLVNSSYPPNVVGGAERVVQTLAEGLVKSRHQVTLITGQPGKDTTRVDVNGVRVYYVPFKNIYQSLGGADRGPLARATWHLIDTYNPMMSHAVGNVLDEVRPEVVNTHNLVGFSVATMAIIKERGFPLVHTLHDQYLLCPRSTMFKQGRNCEHPCFDCSLYARPRRNVSANADIVVGVSQFILERHLQFGYFKNADSRVIYNGVISDPASVPVREKESRPVRFGFLGQVRVTKGLHRLIEAFLEECGKEAELWVGGHGDPVYEAVWRERTERIPSVRWLGFVRPSDFFASIDVLVVPSLWRDTAPLVVLEAAAHGVPVLGSRRGGIPEFITEETGWIFDPDRPAELREALRRCIRFQHRLRDMGVAARELAKRFTVPAFLEGYLAAYNAAVPRPAPPAR